MKGMWNIDGTGFTKIPDDERAFARLKRREFVVGILKTSLYVLLAMNVFAKASGQWSGALVGRMLLYHGGAAALGVLAGFAVR